MFRHILSTLALVGFIASQWAAMPHAHGGSEGAAHSAVPHVHTSSHSHRHGHGHHHHPTHHKHRPNGNGVQDGTNHDSDAIYLPMSTPTVHRGGDIFLNLQALLALLLPADFSTTNEMTHILESHLSQECKPSCARYLQLRALRI